MTLPNPRNIIAVCHHCWQQLHPGKKHERRNDPTEPIEICGLCGRNTSEGLYMLYEVSRTPMRRWGRSGSTTRG